MTPFIIKVVAAALKKFPQFNASIDMATQEIIFKDYINIGVAVDTDRGLIVPVLKNVDKMSILQISDELTAMAERARTRKTTIEEMQGGCFTISNLGGIGGDFFTPIINWPQVAILGVSRGGHGTNICRRILLHQDSCFRYLYLMTIVSLTALMPPVLSGGYARRSNSLFYWT